MLPEKRGIELFDTVKINSHEFLDIKREKNTSKYLRIVESKVAT